MKRITTLKIGYTTTAALLVLLTACSDSTPSKDKFAASAKVDFRPQNITGTKWETCNEVGKMTTDKGSAAEFYYKSYLAMQVQNNKLTSATASNKAVFYEDANCTIVITDVAASLKRTIGTILYDASDLPQHVAEAQQSMAEINETPVSVDLSRFSADANFSTLTFDNRSNTDDPSISRFAMDPSGTQMTQTNQYLNDNDIRTHVWHLVK